MAFDRGFHLEVGRRRCQAETNDGGDEHHRKCSQSEKPGDEVSAGNQEEAQGVEQISKTMLELERAIERSVETAEESAAAGEELAAQTESMNAVARELRVLVTG